MRKPDPLQIALQELADLRLVPVTEAVVETVRRALTSRYNLVTASAAGLCAEWNLTGLEEDLKKAWPRHTRNLPKNDRNCKAKLALVDALYRLEVDATDIFLAGFRHVQMEGTYGPPVDTAAMLRGRSLQALISNRHPDAGRMTVALLFDKWLDARSGAVRAATALAEGELLLRMKCMAGDTEAAVLGECFSALLSMAPETSLSFVARYLEQEDTDLIVLAALALGETKSPEAFACLQRLWLVNPRLRYDLTLPMALLRLDEAYAFLVEQARSDPTLNARDVYTVMEQAGAGGTWLDQL